MIENINWYPGHMKKTRELIQENLKMVDVVIEVVDARIPISSRNPIIDELIGDKPRVIALNKKDLADEFSTRVWTKEFERRGLAAVEINGNDGNGVKKLFRLLGVVQSHVSGSARNKPFRIMIVGVPNVGKSSLINRMTGRKATQTGDRPGVTKGKQWLTLKNGMQLLDTPGILWPKFEDPQVGMNLAFCGSIKDEILDTSELALELIKYLSEHYPDELTARYKLDRLITEEDIAEMESNAADASELPPANAQLANMEAIAKKRGFVMGGGRIDYERTGRAVLDEFRSGAIGRITLEQVIDIAEKEA